ncbi:putative reverse transcriptase domain-containing protein [Tanacetum coccineum]|uniref:Reverse transcriptase domain-containing protein n=1 Tax=Tanacetum coccineum TaxID=301880 RepID=A0ABQ4YNI6_9ASTR
MDIDDEEDENKPELMFPYKETDPLNPSPPASDSEPEDVIEVEDTVEPEDETVSASIHEVGDRIASLSRRLCGRDTAHALVEKKGKAKHKYYGKLILDLVNEVRSSVEEGTAAMENLVRKLGNALERAECKKLKKELGWTEMKKLMTPEFCLAEELHRMENELWNLKVEEYNMVAYTQTFKELALMCPIMVESESVKFEAYIRGLSDTIKGEVTSSKSTNLNKAVCMAHKLMEQKLQA